MRRVNHSQYTQPTSIRCYSSFVPLTLFQRGGNLFEYETVSDRSAPCVCVCVCERGIHSNRSAGALIGRLRARVHVFTSVCHMALVLRRASYVHTFTYSNCSIQFPTGCFSYIFSFFH
jgi:hypothetical protein